MSTDIDYSKFTTLEEIDTELDKHLEELHRLVKHQEMQKQAKKDMAASYNETLKEIKEKIDERMNVIDGFQMQKKMYA